MMTKLQNVQALVKQGQPSHTFFRFEILLIAFVNLAVALISSQVDLVSWLTDVSVAGAGVFIPLSISLSLSIAYLADSKLRAVIVERDKFMLESMHDGLTGLYNRQFLHDSAQMEMERTRRVTSTFSVILLDIDNFKKINDTKGHDVGDQILTKFAQVLEKTVRNVDVVARWGGEEFIIMCRDTNDLGAVTVAQKIQNHLSQTNFPENLHVTASMGVASVEEASVLEDLIKLADMRMYEAKQLGRDRIIHCNSKETTH